jgi:hypothetical protein
MKIAANRYNEKAAASRRSFSVCYSFDYFTKMQSFTPTFVMPLLETVPCMVTVWPGDMALACVIEALSESMHWMVPIGSLVFRVTYGVPMMSFPIVSMIPVS